MKMDETANMGRQLRQQTPVVLSVEACEGLRCEPKRPQLPSSPAFAPPLPARDGRPDSKVRMPRIGLSERHVHVPIPPRHTIKTRGKQAFVASIDLPRLLAPDALEIWPSSS